ncbi:hypothetical protein KFL_000750240 [Klebsormidium nitens]|uniref:NADH:ubiquinone oxidoreductase intermediate-associated protein 30 domain-containing protein n=1 Tax=Klebsormidium nitens TaxID=105231 RepID=A0A0U9HS74_KLENI|nr:hypothetical protein KFL_000750240 [Klebsormidium nitens]|eukprot:GAQ81256.1 hypothetical protein KFL_000750240 [Klebsormidium nitens]
MLRRLVARSVQNVRTALAWNLDVPAEATLFQFKTQADIDRWTTYNDQELGGLSTSSWGLDKDGTSAVFEGELSTEVSEANSHRMKRSGFSGIRTAQDMPPLDLEAFDTLAFRLRGDGRSYISNLRTDNWVVPYARDHNVWQAFLATSKGEWTTVKVPLQSYLPTWQGRTIDAQLEMGTSKVTQLGLALAAQESGEGGHGAGPYRLEIEWIKGLREHVS